MEPLLRHKVAIKSTLQVSILKHNGEKAKIKVRLFKMDGKSCVGCFDELREHFEIDRKFKAAKEYAKEKPVMTLFILMMIAMGGLPVISFLLFLVFSIVLVLISFVFVEGTVLTFAVFILGGVLCVVGLCSLGVTLFLFFSYHAIQICQMLMEKLLEKLGSTSSKADKVQMVTETIKSE